MKDWERKLKQREDMLCDGRQNLGEKEEKIVETENNDSRIRPKQYLSKKSHYLKQKRTLPTMKISISKWALGKVTNS